MPQALITSLRRTSRYYYAVILYENLSSVERGASMDDYPIFSLVLGGIATIIAIMFAILRRFEADVLRSPWTHQSPPMV